MKKAMAVGVVIEGERCKDLSAIGINPIAITSIHEKPSIRFPPTVGSAESRGLKVAVAKMASLRYPPKRGCCYAKNGLIAVLCYVR